MAFPIRATDGLKFQVKQFIKYFYQKWDGAKMIKTDIPAAGFSERYLFDLIDGQQIELSADQWQQALLKAFKAKKHWKDCQYVIKTNGQQGKEIRYFVNLAPTSVANHSASSNIEKTPNTSLTASQQATDPNEEHTCSGDLPF